MAVLQMRWACLMAMGQISMSDVSDSGAKLQSLPFHPMCVERTVVS